MHEQAEQLLNLRTSAAHEWQLDDLLAKKHALGATVTVILPALNEEATVGSIVRQIRNDLMRCATWAWADGLHVDGRRVALVDELVVLDSGCTDRTADVALEAGATVIHRDEVLPHLPAVTGKGEAMWRGLAATSGDLVVFVDADLRSFSSSYVIGLLGPLLSDPATHLVKAVYERPLVGDRQTMPAGGGRVTELVARPLLNLNWPQLAGVIQPLAGEYAARRELLEALAFPCGYGVDLGLLIDTERLHGVRGIAQVDLGVRVHRHHDTMRLGRMAAEIMATATSRLEHSRPREGAALAATDLGTSLTQFERGVEGYMTQNHDVTALERPPLSTVAQYRSSPMPTALSRES